MYTHIHVCIYIHIYIYIYTYHVHLVDWSAETVDAQRGEPPVRAGRRGLIGFGRHGMFSKAFLFPSSQFLFNLYFFNRFYIEGL